ncbi:MAG: ATPase, T2SS/T4P/T4SS family [Deltaproteobacteria bacterium]|nr:ATPase, T2SS/T4P/T4SS family [Deltaproteobacteria bacterium]
MKIGDLLIEKKLITPEELQVALNIQRITGWVIGKCLTTLGFVTSSTLAEVLAFQHGLEYINLRNYPIPLELLRKFPKNLSLNARFLPLNEDDSNLDIAVIDPSNVVAMDTVRSITNKRAKPYLTDEEGFFEALEKAYYFLENPTEKIVDEIIYSATTMGTVTPDTYPLLVDAIIAEGIRRNATDIHISQTSGIVNIFYRVDGILQFAFALPRIVHSGIVSRIKVLSKLDLAEQRLPQDGAFSYDFLGKKYELRVSTIPTIEGESTVLRILLGGSQEIYALSVLGFTDDLVQELKRLIRKPYGIILVVGPTGSGKSTTLYSLVKEINRLKRSVITIEDPVEYKITFAKQSEVNEKIGYDFPIAGRNFMRHDPDVIFLGEIRDEETAKIGIRASITGHLVLSTLHTNDAVSSIPRLLDLGVDRFLLSSSLLAVLSQRLVRKICLNCKKEKLPTDEEKRILEKAGLSVEKVAYGEGCRICRNTGYLGRTGIGELMVVTEEIRDMIYQGASYNDLEKAAQRWGMRPVRFDGLRKVAAGITTLEEIERVVG